MIKTIKNSKLDNEKLDGCQPILNDKLEGFDFSKVIVKKPWGYEYLAYNGSEVSIWILKIRKGAATSMHCHPNKKTTLIALSGEAMLSTLNNSFHLNEGDGLLLDKKVFHSTKAVLDYIIVMETEIPSNKTDLVRLYDKYCRESKGYEEQNEMCFDLKKYEPVLFSESEEKKIGKMCISVENFQDNSSLWNNLKLSGDMIILLLSGEMFNEKNKEFFSAGDIFEINSPGGIDNLKIKKSVKILKIVKNEKTD
ncbi:hypothetical protein D4R86_00185 [bacterium]|nr:MAG: hypothetical protein D4R86_00185 [bacterium]